VPSGGFGAAYFPSVEHTIAKLSQQRRPKREGRRKTGRKQVKKGLNQNSHLFSAHSASGCSRVVSVRRRFHLRASNLKGKPAAAAEKGGRAKNRPKTGEKGLAQITKLWNIRAKGRKSVKYNIFVA